MEEVEYFIAQQKGRCREFVDVDVDGVSRAGSWVKYSQRGKLRAAEFKNKNSMAFPVPDLDLHDETVSSTKFTLWTSQ